MKTLLVSLSVLDSVPVTGLRTKACVVSPVRLVTTDAIRLWKLSPLAPMNLFMVPLVEAKVLISVRLTLLLTPCVPVVQLVSVVAIVF